MSHVAINIDVWAEARQNIFFPGVTPDLDGQCVSAEKGFLQDMTDVPNPQAARGNAKDCGRTLVNQGYAVEVPYDQRRAGDIVCQEYGTYGHVYMLLTGGRVFESNVKWSGVASKYIEGAGTVYASRIGLESESWRAGKNPHVYRVNSYYEGEDVMLATANDLKYLYLGVYAQDIPDAELAKDPFIGTDMGEATMKVLDYANINGFAYWQVKPKLEKQVTDLTAEVKRLQGIIDSSGTLPKGKYLKLNDADLKEVK